SKIIRQMLTQAQTAGHDFASELIKVMRGHVYKDVNLMLHDERLDLVSVCTWPDTHAAIVAEVAGAGVKGILCEKPLALTMSDVEWMLEAASEHGCKLAGGHQYRFHSMFRRAAAIIRDGRLG